MYKASPRANVTQTIDIHQEEQGKKKQHTCEPYDFFFGAWKMTFIVIWLFDSQRLIHLLSTD